ncbi:uncharacterized protein LOC135137360 [Zophobas morio]|uniref:uncharacterized protein LOC135137360 n=1 Tax=Zophobas morio TaxID=2755281 RepID=UPI00308386F5
MYTVHNPYTGADIEKDRRHKVLLLLDHTCWLQIGKALTTSVLQLDLIFSNFRKIQVKCEENPFVREDPHHPTLSITVEFLFQPETVPFPTICTPSYNFRKANFITLYEDLLAAEWTFLEHFVDVNQALEAFYDHLHSLIKKSVPLYTSQRKHSYPPWFTPSLIASLKTKLFYRKKWLSSKNVLFFNEFKRLRTHCKIQISLCYRAYIDRVEQSVCNNPKEIFKYLQMKRGTTRIPGKMYQENLSFETPYQIVNGFAQVFSDIYLPSSSYNFKDDSYSNIPSLALVRVREDDIIKIMASFPIKHTAGDDQIPSFMIHDARYALAQPLSVIINKAIENYTFPNKWKRARIVPVHKKDDISDLKNYRPIAIISNFAKIFE